MCKKTLRYLILVAFVLGIGLDIEAKKKVPPKRDGVKEEKQWVPPSVNWEEREREIQEIKETIPYGIGKEKYVSEVLIRFTAGFSIPRGPHKKEAGHYELGISTWGETGGMVTETPRIKVDRIENIYILDLVNRRILKYSSEGTFLKMIKLSPLHGASDFDIDDEGNIYTLGFPRGFKKGHREHLCNLANLLAFFTSPDSHVSIFFIEKYDPTGKSLGINYFPCSRTWQRENRFWPRKLLSIKGDSIYVFCWKKTFVFKFDSTEELLKLSNISEGTFSPTSGEFYSTKKEDTQGIRLLKGKEKLSPISSVNLGEFLGTPEFIKEDTSGNIYLYSWLKNKREIHKINKNGEVVVSICNLPSFDACKSVNTVTENSNIYVLKYWAYQEAPGASLDSGAELIKWHKEEGE